MRVVVDGVIFGRKCPGGIARYWSEVIRASRHLALPVDFAVILPPHANAPAGVPALVAGSLAAYWAALRADLIHSTYYTSWSRQRCPAVATVYDFVDACFPLLSPNGAGFVERQLATLRQARASIAISRATRDLAAQLAGIDPATIFLAHPGVCSPFSRPPPSAEECRLFRARQTGGAPYLLHVGARKNYKNFRTLFKAYCRVVGQTDRHLMIVGGSGSLTDEEIGLAISSRALERIHFAPRMDDATLRMGYAAADAMVHASLMEGFGIPVIEALACGTGLILSDIPVYREVAANRALFVEAHNVDAWCHALLAPVRVQAHWRDEVLQEFTWAKAARAHAAAYRLAARRA